MASCPLRYEETSLEAYTVRKHGMMESQRGPRGRTRVAILVPAFNEEPVLDRTLAAAAREVGPENVYVADDCSSDLTAHIGRFWTEDNVYTAPVNAGKSRALKQTIDHFRLTARYDGIFLLDADTWLSPGHVDALKDHLTPDVAFVVGRIESDVEGWNFWVYYRAFMMWAYNAFIRTPQNVLNVINVLPGNSTLLSSRAVENIDWERASRLILDDFSMLCDVWYGKLGKIVYIHDTPPAKQIEPLTFRAYRKQTYGRWWPGIWQTMRDRQMFTRTDWFSVTNNLQMLSWIWCAFSPVILILAYYLLQGTVAVWLVPLTIAYRLGETYVLAGLYAWRKVRVSALVLAPLFLAVAYLESVLFTLSYFGSFRLEQGGRWESPARSSTIQKEAA